MPEYRTRPIEVSDIDTICRHRMEMFADAGRDRAVLAPIVARFREWVMPRLGDGRYLGWVAETEQGEVVAGLGMMILDWPPHPLHPEGAERAYVLNVFVEAEHRRRGLAERLMECAHAETVRRGIGMMTLHATPKGRALYEKLGWSVSTEMWLRIGE